MIPPAANAPTAHPPPFPNPDALDEVLHDYLRRADRMGWSPYDLLDHEQVRLLARAERLSECQRSAVQTVLYVEDHLPSYVAEYIGQLADPSLPDAQHARNRQVLRYVFRWAAEEDRHSHVLELYLTRTGLVRRDVLEADLVRERKAAYHFPFTDLVESFVYLALQERATHLYYRALARSLDEPLLIAVLHRMANDEANHAKFFYDLLLKCHRGDLTTLTRTVTRVAREFQMPVQANLTNYRRQVANLMRAAPTYRHPDALGNLLKAVELAAKGDEAVALALVAPGGRPT
jgi:acyl-[acyl-carrier-protein] desaturase